jgi:hypothetical protein
MKMRVLSVNSPTVLLPPPGVGDPLSARWGSPFTATRIFGSIISCHTRRGRGEVEQKRMPAVVASGATAELSEEQVKRHLVV